MLEITSDDIALLDETDLRTLVGRLCEEELRTRRLPTAAVTYGGDQKASDGGLDVRVSLPPDAVVDGFIPRVKTGFQVKRSDMPSGKIRHEMRPKKALRKVIRDLAQEGGAYIIVSSASGILTHRRTPGVRRCVKMPEALLAGCSSTSMIDSAWQLGSARILGSTRGFGSALGRP
jgi:hypothetical protein